MEIFLCLSLGASLVLLVGLSVVWDSCQSGWRRKKEKEIFLWQMGRRGTEDRRWSGRLWLNMQRAWHKGHHLRRKWEKRRGESFGKYKIPLRVKKPCGQDSPCQHSHSGFYKRRWWTRSLMGRNVPQVSCLWYLTDWSVFPTDHSSQWGVGDQKIKTSKFLLFYFHSLTV